MFSRIKTYKVQNIPKELYKKLYGLNHGGGEWLMRPTLINLRHENESNLGRVFLVEDEEDKVASWALLHDWYGPIEAYFYTRKKYRRNGLGKRIAKSIIMFCKKQELKLPGYTDDHSVVAKEFFKRVKQLHRR